MIQFIQNIGDYFSQHFFNKEFAKKVFGKAGYTIKKKDDDDDNHVSFFNKKVTPLRQKYDKFKNDYLKLQRPQDKIKLTHEFHTQILRVLGYTSEHPQYETPLHLDEDNVVPIRYRFNKGNKPYLFIMEMDAMISKLDEQTEGIYDQIYNKEDWSKVFPVDWRDYQFKPDVIKEAISEICLLDETERPTYIIMLAGPKIFLIHYEKWKHDSYLLFDLETLFDDTLITGNRNQLSIFYALLNKSKFISDTDSLLNSLEEDAHKAAYGVTQALKSGVVFAVESLANEAITYKRQQAETETEKSNIQSLMDSETFARELKDECLTFVYRFLFLFYAEARADLEILPVNDTVYQRGYSMEMLRDLEQVPLTSDSSRNGHFFSESLWKLFGFLNEGLQNEDGFIMKKLDSPLFDNEKLKHLKGVQFRNFILQEIILQLSLSEPSKKGRGRISYANLGINQLGSVYESLLAYTGFFAKEDLIEVKNATDKKLEKGTFLVPQSRRDDFKEDEILKKEDSPNEDVLIKKHTFVYRLNGRDRKKSASYYTPEVLTQCTVKYTLKNILDQLRERQGKGEDCANEILSLKILEPAMGAAAFHNEAINQLAVAYLELRENEVVRSGGKRIIPGQYSDELQKVKAYIASNNVYGVDLNPTAIELGKLSLWLNVIHKDMETPFFGYRLGTGNAVVGAWLKAYDYKDIKLIPIGKSGKKWEPKDWWTKAPKALSFLKTKIERKSDQIYHFLLPDKNMFPSANIKLLKEAYPQEADKVKDWRREFTKPIKTSEYKTLQKICKQIDELLMQHYQFQAQVNVCTRNKISIYGAVEGEEQCELDLRTYGEKEDLMNKRQMHEAPYFKLKMIFDYWCSLWFWDVRQAKDLPTRQEWWEDIIYLLDMDMTEATTSDDAVFSTVEQASLFEEAKQMTLKKVSQQKSDTVTLEAITKYTNRRGLYGNKRLELVRDYAEQYRFFHYQLEFVEVFKEREGFDVIVGNPPWVKLQFEEKEIIAEQSPEVMIRKTSATEVRRKIETFFKDENLKNLYYGENIELESTATFLNGAQNYPLLVGQQTNLYKCILENGFRLTAPQGYMGLLHPEGVYDDPKGQVLRKEIYPRLKYHFQYKNELSLFSEVHHETIYGTQIYSGQKNDVGFISINNLFHPSTVETSFVHSGYGLCGGYKVFDKKENKYVWNTQGHKDRIVRITEKELAILALTFENSNDWYAAKLVSIHSRQIISVLEKLSAFPTKVEDFESKTTVAWDETNARNAGIIKRLDPTEYPSMNEYEMIYSGPHFFVANPFYKTPRKICSLNSHYDIIDLTQIKEYYIARTNYKPAEDLLTFKARIDGLKIIGQDKKGKDIYDDWIDYPKVIFSKMLSLSGERTLQPAILPSKVSHIFGGISVIFTDDSKIVELSGIAASILFDFFIKTIGTGNFTDSRLKSLPLGIAEKYKTKLIPRTLILNYLNIHYSDLWQRQYSPSFRQQAWSKPDPRLKAFDTLTPDWQWATPLRNYYERRQALIEIDVITAMALGLSLEELILIYNVQFPVLQQNEDDTWYDQKGNIVFTCSKGLAGVGLDRKEWNEIRNMKAGETYVHTITKSELYKGQEVTYYAPFDKCDRVEDYKEAWAHFEEVFG